MFAIIQAPCSTLLFKFSQEPQKLEVTTTNKATRESLSGKIVLARNQG